MTTELRGFWNDKTASEYGCSAESKEIKKAKSDLNRDRRKVKKEGRALLNKMKLQCGLTKSNTNSALTHFARIANRKSIGSNWEERIKYLLIAAEKLGLSVHAGYRHKRKRSQPSPNFYSSRPWRELRYSVLRQSGGRCMCCKSDDKQLHVDHIKPRSKYPHLELDRANLQVLCVDCNLGKSNIYNDDWSK